MGDIQATATGNTGNFEILAVTIDTVLVNTGVAYDGYGNRLSFDTRQLFSLDWPSIVGLHAFLCIRQKATPILLDYQNHPVTHLPLATKKLYITELYLEEEVFPITFPNGTVGYYPALDSNDIIAGMCLGKLFKDIESPTFPDDKKPDMDFKSPFLSVKDGEYFALTGFNTI